MTRPQRRGLQIDDPLAPARSAQHEQPIAAPPPGAPPQPTDLAPAQTGSEASQPGQEGQKDSGSAPPYPVHIDAAPAEASDGRVWRAWSGITGVGSFRLPHELLVELSDTARRLGLPIGMVVTAAITQLLDQPPEQIAALVDRADDARIHGRRNTRRRLIGPTDR